MRWRLDVTVDNASEYEAFLVFAPARMERCSSVSMYCVCFLSQTNVPFSQGQAFATTSLLIFLQPLLRRLSHRYITICVNNERVQARVLVRDYTVVTTPPCIYHR